MKIKKLPLIAFFATVFAFAQTPCEGGFVAGYPCNELNLQSNISLGEMNASVGNDSWGWTDPDNG